MVNNERICSLDISKVIGIILVVLGHFLPSENILKIMIYSFHVPLFFVISGAVLQTKYSMKEFINKRAKQLIIPYIFYAIISLPVYIKFFDFNFKDVIEELFFYKGNMIWNAPLWFLIVLFEVEVIFYFINKISTSIKTILISSLISIIMCYIIYKNNITVYFGFEKILLLYPFYSLGYYLRHYTKFFDNNRKYGTVISVFCFLLSISFFALFNVNNNISILGFDLNNYWFFTICAFIETLSLLHFVNIIKLNSFFLITRKYTLEIMCTHYFLYELWIRVFSPTVLLAFIGTLIMFIIYFIMIRFVEYKNLKMFYYKI